MYFFLKILEFIFKNIPRKVVYFIFEIIAVVLYFFSRKRKKTLKKNLSAISSNIY